VADIEAAARAGEGDVEEAALFFAVALVAHGARVGEEVLLERDEEDDVEFESLGVVDGHERDAALFAVSGLVARLAQDDGLEVIGQGRFRVFLFELLEGAEEFPDVFLAREDLDGFWVAQGGLVVGLVEDVLDEFAEGQALDLGGPLDEPVGQLLRGLGGFALQARLAQVGRGEEDLEQGQVEGVGVFEQFLFGGLADAPLGRVEDAQEREGVAGLAMTWR
jgi:hypothetical protein